MNSVLYIDKVTTYCSFAVLGYNCKIKCLPFISHFFKFFYSCVLFLPIHIFTADILHTHYYYTKLFLNQIVFFANQGFQLEYQLCIFSQGLYCLIVALPICLSVAKLRFFIYFYCVSSIGLCVLLWQVYDKYTLKLFLVLYVLTWSNCSYQHSALSK